MACPARCTEPAMPNSGHQQNLVDLLHLRSLICSTLNLLQGWEVVVIAQALVIIINAEAKLDHAVAAACVGSSKLNPEVSNEVSKSSQIKSFTVLSDLSALAFFFSSVMMECLGLTSIVFLETMYDVIELSRIACAFMIRSMFADHPYSEVVNTQGESAMRLLTITFSTLSPSTSFINFVRGSNSAFNSSI